MSERTFVQEYQIREELRNLGVYQAIHDSGEHHTRRVGESQVQSGLEIRNAFRQYFSALGDQLPGRLRGVDNSCDIDVQRCAFLKVGSDELIDSEQTQGRLWFENRERIVAAVARNLFRHRNHVQVI